MRTYFNVEQIKDLDELRKEYQRLAKKYHPDAGGTHEDFIAMRYEFEQLSNSFLKNGGFSKQKIDAEVEIDHHLMEIVEALINYDIRIEVIGSWIWASGNTYPIKEELKKAGFVFAPKKKMWYINTTGQKTRSKGMDIDAIRNKYGSKDIKSGRKELNGLGAVQTKIVKKELSALIKAVKRANSGRR